MTTVYLNGEFVALEEARVPVMDRGFLFGDGVYEVIPVYGRQPFRLRQHLARLQSSLDGIRLANPHSAVEWENLIGQIIERAEWRDQGVYLQITRGPGPRDHAFPKTVQPTVFILPMPLGSPSSEAIENGVSAMTATDNRWLRCDLKVTSLLPNVLLRQLSIDADCAETVLIRDGQLIEGSASSVFIVLDGILLAPPESNLMLPGITYDVVLELAASEGMRHEIRPIPETELRRAEEVWITSSTREVIAVTRLDGQVVGSGRPGPVFRQMYACYQTFKRTVMRGNTAP
ncbi:MAG: D-amino acid aminotransferase [Hydrogenophilales bacterium 28-61-23]|nr:MAG: D-amino acid aminotransferase [Hydrogenophilales bacterium 28-61-23]